MEEFYRYNRKQGQKMEVKIMAKKEVKVEEVEKTSTEKETGNKEKLKKTAKEEEGKTPPAEEKDSSSEEDKKEDDKKEEDEKEEKPEGKEEEPEVDFSALLPSSIEEVLKFTAFNLQMWGYVYLGLQLNPKTQKITKDLRQAKLSIDSLSAIVEILMPHLPEAERQEIKIMASNLKMNYISKSREG